MLCLRFTGMNQRGFCMQRSTDRGQRGYMAFLGCPQTSVTFCLQPPPTSTFCKHKTSSTFMLRGDGFGLPQQLASQLIESVLLGSV